MPPLRPSKKTQITLSGGTYSDSLNRQIPSPPTASSSSNTDTSTCPQTPLPADHAALWSVPGPNGTTVHYKFCYAKVAINIPPVESAQYKQATSMSLQSIVLPNGQTWDFAYNDPGDGSTYLGSPVNYGTLTQVTLPTSGTISYSYTTMPGGTCQNGGRWVATRTVNANDGSGPHEWTYAYTYGSSAKVTDPLGNYTIHTLSNFSDNFACSLYETQTKFYQNGGTLLKTVATSYSYTAGTAASNSPLTNVVPTQITTTWPNGTTASVSKSYDSGFNYTVWMGGAAGWLSGSVKDRH